LTGGVIIGTGYPTPGTGATITSLGAVSTRGNVLLADRLQVDGNTFLGSASTDLVKIAAALTIDEQPELTSGFKINGGFPTGATMTSGGTMSMAGGLSVAGHTTIGSAATDTLRVVSASTFVAASTHVAGLTTGNFPTTGASLTSAGALSLIGALSINGHATFGDATTDSVVAKGLMQVAQWATFTTGIKTGTGYTAPGTGATITASGAISIDDSLLVANHATFGSAATDTVKITGEIQTVAQGVFQAGFKVGSGYPGGGWAVSSAGVLSSTGAFTLNSDLTVNGNVVLGDTGAPTSPGADSVKVLGDLTVTPPATFTNGLDTGTGYSGTGASLTAAGALSMDAGILVATTASVLGHVTLGTGSGDTVKIKSVAVLDQATTVASTATFTGGLHTGTGYAGTGATLTSTGALSMDAGILVGTTASVLGHVTLGTANTDTIKVKGVAVLDQVATFTSGLHTGTGYNPGTGATLTSTGALSMDAGIIVGTTMSVLGHVTIGTGSTDTLKVKSTPVLDQKATFTLGLDTGTGYAGTGATFTATGDISLDGNLFVDTVAHLKGATTLGNGAGSAIQIGHHTPTVDSITIGGNVAMSAHKLLFDLSSSTGNFKTTTGTVHWKTHASTCPSAPGPVSWPCA